MPYSPPFAEMLRLQPLSEQFLQTSPTGENYDDELVYEGF